MNRHLAIFTGLLILAIAIVACGAPGGNPPALTAATAELASPTVEAIAGYTSWQKANKQPHRISARAFQLCDQAGPRVSEGPHGGGVIDVRVSPLGYDAFVSRGKRVPVGTVVVKEKRTSPKESPVLLTVMTKKSNKGVVDDWQFSAVSGDGIREVEADTGKCRSCHEKAGEDHLFRPYVTYKSVQ